MPEEERRSLAWHETLELHELVAFQSNGLMKLKRTIEKVTDPELKAIYRKSIMDIEGNLKELLPFYATAAQLPQREEQLIDEGYFSGNLLGLCKTTVRNYAIAITETATPQLRSILTTHINKAIKGHDRIFNYMHKRGFYPAYDLGELLSNDLINAKKALDMKCE
jgi:spore coat protein F